VAQTPAPKTTVAATAAPALGGEVSPQPVYEYQLPRPTNTFAIISLVSAIAGAHLLGIVFGHIALVQIKRTGDDGRGLAIAGLIVGYVLFAFTMAFVVIWLGTIFLTFGLAILSAGLSYS
jgi:hypothetical protein